MATQTFDDGSTITFHDDLRVTSTDAADIVQGATGSAATGFFGVLDSFSGLATTVGHTVATLQGQAGALEIAKANNELERTRALAAVKIGQAQTEVAIARAQREVAIAKGSDGGLMTLILLGLAAYAVTA